MTPRAKAAASPLLPAQTSGLSDHMQLMDRLREDLAGFERLAMHLRRVAGINLATNEKNQSLMAARLGPLLKNYDLLDYGALAQRLAAGDSEALRDFVEALTTNTTHFFRENVHFELLGGLLPKLQRLRQAQGKSELRLWCAACSTGQEPYTMLMTLLESLPTLQPSGVKFLASDIDQEVLGRASRGLYTDAEVEAVPLPLRAKYFAAATEHASGHTGSRCYRVNSLYRRMITFAPVNLTVKPLPFQHGFDVIFCRNVLIYFEREMAIEVTSRLLKALAPNGLLFLGHSESGLMKGSGFKSIASAVYQKDG